MPGLRDPALWAEAMVSNHVTNIATLQAIRIPVDVGTIEVAMPSGAATPGQNAEGSELYLMTAISPDSAYGFITISGDGLIQVLDLEAREVIAEIETPSPLAGGGYTTVVQPGVVPVDLWGR